MKTLRILLTASVLAMSLATPAFAQGGSGSAWKTAAWYLPNRVLDLLDIFKLNVAGGLGGALDLRLTRLLEAGFSDYNVVRVGLNGRNLPVYNERIDEASLSLLGITSGQRTRDAYEVGITFHFLVLGAEAAVNVRSLLDFAGGFVLLDLEDDDLGKSGGR